MSDGLEVTEISALDPAWTAALTEAAGPGDQSLHPSFLRAYRASTIEGVTPRWFLASSGERPLALAGAAVFEARLDCLAPGWVQRLNDRVRGVVPGFLGLRVMMCGAPAGLAEPGVAVFPGVEDALAEAARDALLRELWARVEDERLTALCWKEFQRETPARAARVNAVRLRRHPSPAKFVQDLPFEDMEGYRSALRSGYRRQLDQAARRAAAAGLEVRLGQPFAEHASAWHPLFLQVLDRADQRLETLPAAFFSRLAEDPAYRLNTATLEGRLVGGALCRVVGETLVFLYVGHDQAASDRAGVYHQLLRSVLELAFQQGCRRIQWGQTSGDAKGRLGAEAQPCWFYLRFRRGVTQAAVDATASLLFPEDSWTPRRVFKQG